MMLKRPRYVEFDVKGRITELFCKKCGVKIAGIRDILKDRHLDQHLGQWKERFESQFRHFVNYAEIKISFTDGSSHVTNGCTRCLQGVLTVDDLHAMHQADMDMDEAMGVLHVSDLRNRVPVKISAINTDGTGIP